MELKSGWWGGYKMAVGSTTQAVPTETSLFAPHRDTDRCYEYIPSFKLSLNKGKKKKTA